jgi:DNA-binding transcriptional MocR family regulator
VPRYWQVAVILATRIEDGTYKRRFPPLGELAAELRVERQTVRRGIEVLASRGVVEVMPGWGTFVRAGRERQPSGTSRPGDRRPGVAETPGPGSGLPRSPAPRAGADQGAETDRSMRKEQRE